jgi:hypothetical protein
LARTATAVTNHSSASQTFILFMPTKTPPSSRARAHLILRFSSSPPTKRPSPPQASAPPPRCQPYSSSRHTLSLSCPDTLFLFFSFLFFFFLLPGAATVAVAPPWIFHQFSGSWIGESGALNSPPPDPCSLIAAMSNTLLRVYPSDLKMPCKCLYYMDILATVLQHIGLIGSSLPSVCLMP